MKKVIATVVVLALVLAVVVGGLMRHHAAVRPSTSQSQQHERGDGDASAHATTIPDWIPQVGAPPRRIAGRVVFQGAPVGGAKVTLGFEAMGERGGVILSVEPGLDSFGVAQRVAEMTSAPDGTFDFGPRPPARFMVSALAENHAVGAMFIDNANPRAGSDQLIVQLPGCGTRVSGVVADASGGGIAKASISVDSAFATESDARGNYKLCVAARDAFGPPNVQIRVEADGYGTTRETVLAVGDMRYDFQLVPEAVLVGRVTTSGGEPVVGARVIALAEPQEMAHHVASGWAESDKDGRFRIARLAAGAFQLMAQAKGISSPPLAVFAQPTTTSREIHLVLDRKPLARVRGHVFKANEPVGGIQIQAVQDGWFGGTSVSQADGSFVFDALPYGKTRFFAPPNQTSPLAEIAIGRAAIDDVRIDITKSASVHGHVTRHGKPVPGADVLFMPPPQANFFGPPPGMRTDASGAFALELPAGPGQLLAWDNSQKAFANPQPFELASNEDKTVDIELDRAGEVTGTVVNETGSPVPGVYMRLDLTDGSGDMCESMTDHEGGFDCIMLVGGEYRATVTPSPGGRQGFAPADHFDLINVPKDEVVTGVRLAIKDQRFAIRGIVVDDTGAPMSDVHVAATAPGAATMDFPSTLSDAAGHFEIANLARGTYNLDAHAADGSDTVLPDVASGSTAVSIKLARAGGIEGSLTGFSTTPSVYYTAITLAPPGPGQLGLAIVDRTKFSRGGLPPGPYTVEATGGTDSDAVNVEVRAGETAHVDLHSRGVGSVEGTVSELGTHKPIGGMRCDAKISTDGQARPFPPELPFQTFTDASGHFKVSAPVGRVRIFCFLPNGGLLSPAGTDVDVRAGETAKVSVFSVRQTFGTTPGNAGFIVTPQMPVTIGVILTTGPAASAGLHAGDQLVAIDGMSLQGLLPDAAITLVLNHRPGTVVTLGVQRGGAVQTIKLTVSAGLGP
jgi:hypothetical protein